MPIIMAIFNALFAALIGFYVGKFMATTVYYLPEILLEGCDKGRVPRDIITWFFQKNHPNKITNLPFQIGIAFLFGVSTLFFQFDAALIFVLIVSCILICCFITDYQYGILPDEFTLTLVWVGLLGSLNPIFITPSEAIIGAVGGYGIFWAFNVIYRYFRHQEGMYPGDFKLNAGIGACIGFKMLVPILVISLLLLILVTSIQHILNRGKEDSNYLYKEVPYACYVTVVFIIGIYINLFVLFQNRINI